MEKDKDKKLQDLLNIEETVKTEEILKVKDGLFEHSEIVNKKYVSVDGRQLLKEVKYQA
jgi:hypothetical protein